MREFDLGRAVPRTEDFQLLRGRGRYTDDIVSAPANAPSCSALAACLGAHPHHRLGAAVAAPGVLAILTGRRSQMAGAWYLLLRGSTQAAGRNGQFCSALSCARARSRAPRRRPRGRHHRRNPGPSQGRRRLVEIDWEMLPSVTDTAARPSRAPPRMGRGAGQSLLRSSGRRRGGGRRGVRPRQHVVTQRLPISAGSRPPMEGRTALGDMGSATNSLHPLCGDSRRAPHARRARDRYLRAAGLRFRLISPDVGGGFGMKGSAFPELALVLWAAKRIGRPVKWMGERSESFVADHHARDNVSDVAGARRERQIPGVARQYPRQSRRLSRHLGVHVATNNIGGLAGPVHHPAHPCPVRGYFPIPTPPAPIAAPEGRKRLTVIERVIDIAARETGSIASNCAGAT